MLTALRETAVQCVVLVAHAICGASAPSVRKTCIVHARKNRQWDSCIAGLLPTGRKQAKIQKRDAVPDEDCYDDPDQHQDASACPPKYEYPDAFASTLQAADESELVMKCEEPHDSALVLKCEDPEEDPDEDCYEDPDQHQDAYTCPPKYEYPDASTSILQAADESVLVMKCEEPDKSALVLKCEEPDDDLEKQKRRSDKLEQDRRVESFYLAGWMAAASDRYEADALGTPFGESQDEAQHLLKVAAYPMEPADARSFAAGFDARSRRHG